MPTKTTGPRASRPLRWGLLAPVVAAALVACGGGGGGGAVFLPIPVAPGEPAPPTPPVVAKAKKTVLIYMNGSDLESGIRRDASGRIRERNPGMAATQNIQEMLQVRFGADVNVVLETGGTEKPGWDTLRRQQIKDQKLIELAQPANPHASMADPATLVDFVTWGARAFPAEEYVLFFWNHGGGPNGGFGVDQINSYQGAHSMTVADIRAALEQGVAAIGQKFQLIGFDACLMASLEIASALSGVGDYLAASSDLEPGDGWDYQSIMGYLARRPDASGEQLGRRIADSYVAKNESPDTRDLTFSVTDLRRVDALQSAVDELFRGFSLSLAHQGLPAWTHLASARARTLDFTTDMYMGENSTDLMDLGGFLDAPALGNLPLATELARTRDALDDAVVFKRWGSALESSSGLTLYFPSLTLRSAFTQRLYQQDAAASAALRQFNLDYVNYVLDGHVPSPVVGQPAAQADGALFSSLSSTLYESGYGVLQGPDGAIFSTQPAERGDDGLRLPAPQRWPMLMGVPLLMASEFDPAKEGSDFVVPALLDDDCEPGDEPGLRPFKQSSFMGTLVVSRTGSGDAARYRVTGYHPRTGTSQHGTTSRRMAVRNGACFALPQLRFDASGVLHYEFTPERFVQFFDEDDREVAFQPLDLRGHQVHTAVSDYTGQLLFSQAPARY